MYEKERVFENMERDKTFLGTEPIGKLLLKLAVPTVIAQLVNMLYNIIDRVYIGHIPGEGSMALTGVGVCMPLILIIAAFAALVGSGGSPRASIYMGKGDHDTAEKILTGCLSLQIIVSIILTVILLIWNKDLLLMFGASENTITYATAYMNIYAIGTIFVQITLGMNTFITAQGKATTGMMTVLIGAVANIILDPIFIFGMHMGVRGAALATVISQGLSCIWVLTFLSGKKTLLRIKKANILPGLRLVPPCVALGASMFVMQASESVISVCFNSSLLKYGGDIAVGAMTILTSVMQFAMLPLQGIAQGAQPITSYNYGAKNKKRLSETIRFAFLLEVLTGAGMAVVLGAAAPLLVGLFLKEADVIAVAQQILRVQLIGMPFVGIVLASTCIFQAIGNGAGAMILSAGRQGVIFAIVIFCASKLAGFSGVIASQPVSDFLTALVAVMILLQWKKKEFAK